MEQAQQGLEVTIQPATWTAETANWLTFAQQHATLEDLREQINQGAALFHVYHLGQLVGAMILRVDQSASGAEGVVVAAAGRLPGFDFTLDLLPHVEKMFHNVKSVRIHTARPGMARKLARAGYQPSEMVFSKAI